MMQNCMIFFQQKFQNKRREMSNLKEYMVETNYPYEFIKCASLSEARQKVKEFKKKGRLAHIVMSQNGQDYILE